MNLLRDSFLFLDCQTTGANPVLGGLLEVAWCQSSASEQNPGSINCTLVRQPDTREIPFRVQMITGISEDDMKDAVHEREVYFALKEHFNQHALKTAIVHYASFEKPFLKNLFEKHGNEEFPLELVCTHQIAKRLFPNLPTRGIRGLGGFFGASNCELKRSSHHVEITFSIWQGLVNELAKHNIHSMEELQDWLKTPVKTKRTKYEYPLQNSKRLSLPDKSGVYKMLNAKGEVLYVGKATSLKSRVNSYFRGQKNRDPRKLEMLTQTHDIAYIECGSALEAAILETDEIKRHNPPYNVSLKQNQRQLAFFSSDLSVMSRQQSDQYPVGPFSGNFALEQFSRVQHWLESSEDDPLIFFNEVPIELIAEGFEIFCETENIDPTMITTSRDLMASCIKMLRRYARMIANHEPTNFDLEPSTAEEPDIEVEDDDSLVEYTPEEVAGKFARLFQRSAKAYLRGKLLTRLLNSRLIFEEKSNIRRLEVRNGEIVKAEEASAIPDEPESFPWANLDVMTYDRMSVLLAEIGRMRASGQNVIVEPDLALGLVSHQIV